MLGGKKGGVEQSALGYCEILRALGHQPQAILRTSATMVAPIRDAGFDVVEIAWPQGWNIFARMKIAQILSSCDFAILHGNRAGEITAGIKSVPIIAVAHSRFFKLLPHYRAVIALSKAAQKRLSQKTSLPIFLLPHAVEIPTIISRPPFHTPPVIGVMGRLSQEKGIDLFLDALGILKERNIDFHAKIAGAGQQEAALRLQAQALRLQDSVTFLGWVDNAKEFYHSIDIFCLPSRSESFSLTLCQAMAHGCPVVATDCDGPRDIIAHQISGLLTEINAVALAQALEKILQNPTLALELGERARISVEENFVLPVIAEKLDDVMRQMSMKDQKR